MNYNSLSKEELISILEERDKKDRLDFLKDKVFNSRSMISAYIAEVVTYINNYNDLNIKKTIDALHTYANYLEEYYNCLKN